MHTPMYNPVDGYLQQIEINKTRMRSIEKQYPKNYFNRQDYKGLKAQIDLYEKAMNDLSENSESENSK